jgi:hypothetical protein
VPPKLDRGVEYERDEGVEEERPNEGDGLLGLEYDLLRLLPKLLPPLPLLPPKLLPLLLLLRLPPKLPLASTIIGDTTKVKIAIRIRTNPYLDVLLIFTKILLQHQWNHHHF